MKLKLTCLLLLVGLSASPNRFCNGFKGIKAASAPHTTTVTDDSDLLPTKHFFNHI